jgi:hypothetical protein
MWVCPSSSTTGTARIASLTNSGSNNLTDPVVARLEIDRLAEDSLLAISSDCLNGESSENSSLYDGSLTVLLCPTEDLLLLTGMAEDASTEDRALLAREVALGLLLRVVLLDLRDAGAEAARFLFEPRDDILLFSDCEKRRDECVCVGTKPQTISQ